MLGCGGEADTGSKWESKWLSGDRKWVRGWGVGRRKLVKEILHFETAEAHVEELRGRKDNGSLAGA